MSYQFHIPPINQLSFNQQHAYGFPLDERECLLITGCPGSGKTTVANFRASALQQEQRTFQYIIYARVLHAYVRQSFSDPALDIAPEKVATFGSWFYGEYKENVMAGPRKIIPEVLARHFARSTVRYNEMILDEGQDLDPRVIQGLPQVCTSLTICADDAQNVFDGDENEPNSCEGMRTALEAQGLTVHPIHLGVNYRNTPEIYAFAKAFVPHNPAATVTQFIKAPGQRPALLKCSNTASMLQKIENIITNRGSENIGILCDYQSQITAISRHLEQKG
ncbi:MAG TPA: AAA family ATPase, partial [Chitinophagaceae bacterium]|nr:AAA family ATPase [Chitinophagaceae bacterium]